MKRTVLFFCILLTALGSTAQTVSGRIIDGTTNKPLDFVNVTLYKIGSDVPQTGGLSDTNGKFELTAPEGEYTFKATFIGYTEFSKNITLSASKPRIRLGSITLNEDAKQIAEVEVVGQKSGMTLDIDKKVFNVDQSVLGEGATASEILENIPSVDIDMDGNVSLRNSSSVEIWINGKPSGLSDTDKGQILEMLPASTIKSVEVITNPSAKYSPEGNAGIINIVMRDDAKGGYFGNVSTGINYREGSKYPGGNIGLNFNYSSTKWDVNLSANVRNNRADRGSYLNRESYSAGDTTYLHQTTKRDMDRVNGFLRAGFTYHITKVDDISLNAMGMLGGNWNNSYIDYTDMDRFKDTTMIRKRKTNSNGIMGFYRIGASYKHDFKKDEHTISADVNYFGNIRNSDSRYYNDTIAKGLIPIPTNQRQTLRSPNNSGSAQIDYMNKITKDHKIEAGAKAELTFNNSYDSTYDPNIRIYYNPFNYKEQIYAAYINYAGKFKWFSLQVGLRCEETITDTKSLEDGESKSYHRSYFQPFPSVYMGFEINKTNTLQLNYTRRINRPRGPMLNSYIDRTDPMNIRQGNPWLMPEFGNALELNYLKTWDMHTLSVQLFYRYTENVIQRVSSLKALGIMYSTFENITYSQNAGLEIVAKNRLFHNYLDLTTSLSGYYAQVGANEEYKIKETNSFSFNARVNTNVKIIDNLSAQVNFFYNSPRTQVQGSTDHNYGMDLGLKANFLKKKLSLSFSVRDVLDSRQRSENITYSDNFYQKSNNTSSGRSYRLTLTYNFGNLKDKKRDRTNQNQNAMGNDDFDEDF